MNVLQLILAALSTATLCATVVYVALAGFGSGTLAFSGEFRQRFSITEWMIVVGAAIGFFVCVWQGAETMLYWIPGDWGSFDEDGEWVTIRSGIALTLTSFSMLLLPLFGNASANRAWRRILSMEVRALEEIIGEIDSPGGLEAVRQKFLDKNAELARDHGDRDYHSLREHGERAVDAEMQMYFRLAELAEKQRERLISRT